MLTPEHDVEYLLALAEEEHIRREALHRSSTRMARIEHRAEICAHLRTQILWLMYAPFSWQLSTESHPLLRTLPGLEDVNRSRSENIQKTVADWYKWLPRADSSAPSRHTRVAGSQGACLSEKPSAHEVMHVRSFETIPGNAAPIAPWPVTPRGVSHAGNAEYPDRKTEEGHGEKGEPWANESDRTVDHVR